MIIDPPEVVEVIYDGPIYRREGYWQRPGYSMRQWVDHLFQVMHYSKLDEICFNVVEDHLELETIDAFVNGIDIKALNITRTFSPTYFLRILQKFPSAKQLHVSQNPFKLCQSEQQKILIQNYDILKLQSRRVDQLWENFPLDDLLIINSRRVLITTENFTNKNLNQFLKHWLKGSNPRLELLHIQSKNVAGFDAEIALKGILHEERRNLPRDKIFDECIQLYRGEQLNGVQGIDIRRGTDGSVATLQVIDTKEGIEFQFVVWHED
ncbi:hypothetical protein GCK72_008489 [Caenorhabditis remanei]|uniref:Sdz-33 F-box domain-containing protein n=1 Tax=Caenorhabditis remanei TaxID=31234 RepID=A0A6A5H0S8_CAERE|nr:hypothetical protein GCK72_008489 [Caenorhabditis remanei]KAF1760243.1 hypothetical protein GCK72_008489 [Caenorhabditis remanei]